MLVLLQTTPVAGFNKPYQNELTKHVAFDMILAVNQPLPPKGETTMSKLCYTDMSQYKLCYDNQMDFKRWAKHYGFSKKNGADYYFDCVTPVDARDLMKQNSIPGFLANGKTTWGEALNILKAYFKIVA